MKILASFLDCLLDFFFFYVNKCYENASIIIGKIDVYCVFKNKANIANQALKPLFDLFYDVTMVFICLFQFEK